MKLVTINHDVITGQITEIELTKEQISAREKMAKQANEANKQWQAEAEAKFAAKVAIADRLGLTADELKLLLG